MKHFKTFFCDFSPITDTNKLKLMIYIFWYLSVECFMEDTHICVYGSDLFVTGPNVENVCMYTKFSTDGVPRL